MPADDHSELHRETERDQCAETLCRLLVWMADAPTMLDRGLRATVALNCLRPDLLGSPTLERIGRDASRRPQYVHALGNEFRTLVMDR